jgi:hypothetical protein
MTKDCGAQYDQMLGGTTKMAEETQDWTQRLSDATDWLEKELTLPKGFIAGLVQEDDWSFVIKAHALVEAALTNQLSASVDERLTSVFEQLELSDSRKGKIAFSKALGLLDSNQRKFIRFLSELRNELVHDVRRVAFDLNAHLSTLDSNQKAAFIDSVIYFATNLEGWRSQATKNPKSAIFAGTLLVLVNTTTRGDKERREREYVYWKAKAFDDLLKGIPPPKE